VRLAVILGGLLTVLAITFRGGPEPTGEPVRAVDATVAGWRLDDGRGLRREGVQTQREEGTRLLRVLSTHGVERNGRLVIDAFERDFLYLAVALYESSGEPVADEMVLIDVPVADPLIREGGRTDAAGYHEFTMVAMTPGRHTVRIQAGGVETLVDINTVGLRETDVRHTLRRSDVTPWHHLASADLQFDGIVVHAKHDPAVLALDGQEVVLGGFMLALEPGRRQHHFLLTANPPHCYFHLPGGPTTVAEVRSERGIDVSNDPILLRARIEVLERSDLGILYRLHGARSVPNRAVGD
jgi:hypothetical protein